MSVPTYDQFIEPILRYLAATPEGATARDAHEAAAGALNLSETQRQELIASGQATYKNRAGWAHDRLKRASLPEGIHCCGFAGDKGFTTPELNSHALRSLKDAVQFCEEGISTSRTCEIGLSQHSGIDYHGLVYLVDRVSRRKPAFQPASSQSAQAPILDPVAEWP